MITDYSHTSYKTTPILDTFKLKVKQMLKYFNSFYIVLFMICLITENGYSQFGKKVVDTPHNLLKATQGSMAKLELRNYDDVCVYCHIQHARESNFQIQLWNRRTKPTNYKLYASPETDMMIAGTIDSTSLGCLSCHDDTTPLDEVKHLQPQITSTKTSNITISSCTNICHTTSNPSGGISFEGGNMGTDLRSHHPVGIIYDVIINSSLNPASGGKVNGLPLYGPNLTQVGCASCHDPHDNTFRPFLRISNNNAELCQACHNI